MMTFFLSFGIYCTLALRNSRYHIWPLEECANTRIKEIFKKNCTHNTIQLGSIVRTYKADVYRYSPRKKNTPWLEMVPGTQCLSISKGHSLQVNKPNVTFKLIKLLSNWQFWENFWSILDWLFTKKYISSLLPEFYC